MFNNIDEFQDFLKKWTYMNTLVEEKFEGSQRAIYLTFEISKNNELIAYTDPGDGTYEKQTFPIKFGE